MQPYRARRRTQREIDRDQRRAAANRRIGHDMAYWYAYGPPVAKVAGLLALAGGCWWVWENVDHRHLSTGFGVTGVGLLLAFGASTLGASGSQARIRARATGQTARSPWWYAVAAAGVLMLGAAYLLMGAA